MASVYILREREPSANQSVKVREHSCKIYECPAYFLVISSLAYHVSEKSYGETKLEKKSHAGNSFFFFSFFPTNEAKCIPIWDTQFPIKMFSVVGEVYGPIDGLFRSLDMYTNLIP